MDNYRYAGWVILSLLLASCGNKTPAPNTGAADPAEQAARVAVEQAAAAADKEAATSAQRAAVPRDEASTTQSATSSSIPAGGRPTNPEAENTVKAFINLHGELCAEIVSVKPLALPNTAEVTCVEYRGGSSHVTYVINIVSGDLQKAG